MPLYEVSTEGLRRRDAAQFAELGLYERADLQRLLREEPAALGEDLLIVSEEFGQWEDSRRRIDLLALDRDGHLVVIELKRTTDGGYMELQALRYAAMVSSMTLGEVVEHYERHCAGKVPPAMSAARRTWRSSSASATSSTRRQSRQTSASYSYRPISDGR